MKTFQEAMQYIEESMERGSVLGLDNIRALLEIMGNPQEALNFVHVAGTNGKGSIIAFLNEILINAGYKVGRYTSPTLLGYLERIQINGQWISEHEFVEELNKISNNVDKLQKDGKVFPTAFEIETALAFSYFNEKKCDIVLLETGMGGRLDATNVITSALAYVFSSVSIDHQGFLGNTIEEIAREKSGIIKLKGSVITGEQDAVVERVLKERAAENAVAFLKADTNSLKELYFKEGFLEFDYFNNNEKLHLQVPLTGKYQKYNLAVALKTIEVLQKNGFRISNQEIADGIKNTKWFGRFTKVLEKPVIYVDGAHNLAAARELRKTLMEYFPNEKFVFVIGMFKDKDYKGILDQMLDLANKVIVVTLKGERGLAADEIVKEIKKINRDISVTECEGVNEILQKIKGNKDFHEKIVAFGSLSYLNEFTKKIKGEFC